MAKPSFELIEAIRHAARNIDKTKAYQWGHMGSCNCGHLAQEITKLSKTEIHQRAMMRYGDWSEQLNDYCPTSGLPMDKLISDMLEVGLGEKDLRNLETLSDGEVLRTLPVHERWLKHNVKADVVKYMLAWASLLEQKLLEKVSLRDLKQAEAKRKATAQIQ